MSTEPLPSSPTLSLDAAAALRTLTTWNAPAARGCDESTDQLWRKALAEAAPEEPIAALRAIRIPLRSGTRWRLLAALLCVSATAALVVPRIASSPRFLPSHNAPSLPSRPAVVFDLERDEPLAARINGVSSTVEGGMGVGGLPEGGMSGARFPAASNGVPAKRPPLTDVGTALTKPPPGPQGLNDPSLSSALTAFPSSSRSVIRNAAMDLTVTNLSEAFARSIAVVHESESEFVESSRLDAANGTASVVVRVAGSRLVNVLAELRALGDVRSETVQGTDVTEQIIDLDARLRNERRIETELLGILDTRKNAPLDDLMSVRSRLDLVRNQIERLVAEQERAKRQVSFSTITVTMSISQPETSPADAKKGAAASTSGDDAPPPSYAQETLRAAWRDAIRSATDGVAFLLTLAIGGLPWWCLALGVWFVAHGWWHRRVAAGLA